MKRMMLIFVISFHLLNASEGLTFFDYLVPADRITAEGYNTTLYWNPAMLTQVKGFSISSEFGKFSSYSETMPYTMNYLSWQANEKSFFSLQYNYLNLSVEGQTDEIGNELGSFASYFVSGAVGYAAKLSNGASLGINAKINYEMLPPILTIMEKGHGDALFYCFDLGYKKEFTKLPLVYGIGLFNIGPGIPSINVSWVESLPMHFRLDGITKLYNSNLIKLKLFGQIYKDLVASYPKMDVNGDYIISEGEQAYSDSWYKSIFTSWFDDAKYAGDIDYGSDDLIGGYDENGDQQGWYQENGTVWVNDDDINNYGYNENGEYEGWGKYDEDASYNDSPKKEVGSQNNGSISQEFEKLEYKFGISVQITDYLHLRLSRKAEPFWEINRDQFSATIGPAFLNYTYTASSWVWTDTDSSHKFDPLHSIRLNINSELLKKLFN
ncbi:MAG: hypothetical protein KAI81_03750 [Candidatus Marinimicrobia bacterium]|nr:hypothetical protein [Candidatus Neomarinimicrobiota bacterium]